MGHMTILKQNNTTKRMGFNDSEQPQSAPYSTNHHNLDIMDPWFLLKVKKGTNLPLLYTLFTYLQALKVALKKRNSGPFGYEKELPSALQKFTADEKKVLISMESRPHYMAIRVLSFFLCRLWRAVFSQVNVDEEGAKRIKKVCAEARKRGQSVIFLPTHRSHVDYLLMSYVCVIFDLPMPYICSGDNLNMFLIGAFLRAGGAFFIKRKMNTVPEVYKETLRKYIAHILKLGNPVEVFIEGGRSRSGHISKPKTGMLRTLETIEQEQSATNIYIPISIDYENVLENINCKTDNGYAAQLLGGKKNPESFFRTISVIARLVLGGNPSHGKVFINFGNPVSGNANEVAKTVVSEQRRTSVVSSVSILSLVLLNLSKYDVKPLQSDSQDHPYAEELRNFKHQYVDKQPYLASSMFNLLQLAFSGKTANHTSKLLCFVVVPRFKLLAKFFAHVGFNLDTALIESMNNNWEGVYVIVDAGMRVLESLFRRRLKSRVDKDTADAHMRLNLRYTCGQLFVNLVPYTLILVNQSIPINPRVIDMFDLRYPGSKKCSEETLSDILSFKMEAKLTELEFTELKKHLLYVVKPTLIAARIEFAYYNKVSDEIKTDFNRFTKKMQKFARKCLESSKTEMVTDNLPEVLSTEELNSSAAVILKLDVEERGKLRLHIEDIVQNCLKPKDQYNNYHKLSGNSLAEIFTDVELTTKRRIVKMCGGCFMTYLVYKKYLKVAFP
eukprot:maker-scaffold_20-snap-gene-5.7-mRNA-1 protein AED:0.00 eAED:0.00 QI:49/1/1/1/1/1/3/141/725